MNDDAAANGEEVRRGTMLLPLGKEVVIMLLSVGEGWDGTTLLPGGEG